MAVLAAATPAGLATGLVAALLLTTAAFLRFTVMTATVAAASLALVTLHGVWLAPAFTGRPPRAADGESIVVMLQNFEYGDATDLARVVEARKVDLLVLVDVTRSQQADVAASDLATRFGAVGVADTSSRTLVLSRLALGPLQAVTKDGRSSVRMVKSSAVGPFALIAAHPVAPYADSTLAWRRQLASIAASASRTSSATQGAMMLMGDLNATADQRPFRELRDEARLSDAAELANLGWAPTFPANGLHTTKGIKLPPVVAIDHVMLGPAFTTTDVQHVTVTEADHLGVVARVARAAS